MLLVELPADAAVAALAGTRRHGPRWRSPPPPSTGPAGTGVLPVRRLLAELAAVRWAARHDVPVVACDLPLADPTWAEGRRAAVTGPAAPGSPPRCVPA
ncbi:DUF5682 family protein [Streptomyces sp. INA 01156]